MPVAVPTDKHDTVVSSMAVTAKAAASKAASANVPVVTDGVMVAAAPELALRVTVALADVT